MSIGRGWYEDENEDDGLSNVRTLAETLLREKLAAIFKIAQENRLTKDRISKAQKGVCHGRKMDSESY